MSSLLCGIPKYFTRRKQQKSDAEITTSSTYSEVIPITTEKSHVSAKDLVFNSASSSSATIAILNTQAAQEPRRPKTQRALTVRSKGKYALVDDYPIPELAHDKEVVIRNYAVGLNPIDWKSVDYNFCLPAFPWVTGREMAGVVERVGSEVTSCKVGDRVWTSTYYKDSRAGCFQELVTVPAHTVSPMPKNISFEQAACLGVAALTAAMTLWRWLEVPLPASHTPSEEYLLVWGGSAVTGQFAIQIAKLGGLKVVAVCSEKTKSMCEGLGATCVTRDGKSLEEIQTEITAVAGDKITRVIDLVGNSTAAASLAVVSKSLPVHVAPLAMMKEQEVGDHVKVHTVEMKRFVLDEESAVWAKKLNAMIEGGSVRLPNIEVLKGGLGVVESGLERLKKGDMNGMKVVVALV